MGLFSRFTGAPTTASSEEESSESVHKSVVNPNAIYIPFEHPISGSVSQPEVPNDKIIDDEEKKVRYQKVYDYFAEISETKEYPVDTTKDCKKIKLGELEKAWLTKECFLRYLRACSWKVDDAIERLENSIVWRREYGIANGIYGEVDSKIKDYQVKEFNSLTPEMIKHESLSGKQILFGFDKGCRPCLYLYTGRENTKPSENQVKFLIFMLECVINYMPQGQDKLALCVDFQDFPNYGLKKKPMPSPGVGKAVLHILQYHYPERLGRALFINIPMVASIFLKLCWPFLDPYTKQKTAFDKPFEEFIPKEQLPTYYDGDAEFEFDAEKYWDGLIKIGSKKYELYINRYFELGGETGLSEVDLRLNEKIPTNLKDEEIPTNLKDEEIPSNLKDEEIPPNSKNGKVSTGLKNDLEKLKLNDDVNINSQEIENIKA